MPTDTIYGIVASVYEKNAVQRIYDETRRPANKPLIVLISSRDQLEGLEIQPTPRQTETLRSVWPGPVSVILNSQSDGLTHLDRGTRR